MTPARPPFIQGERLIYAPNASTRWPVTVVNPNVWGLHDTLYCRQSRVDGAPRDGHDYRRLTHLFREAAP
jgi:hypothetical protein